MAASAPWGLAAVAAVGLLRLGELAYARHTARGLLARGARAVRPDGYAAIVAVQVLWLAGCAWEPLARPSAWPAPAAPSWLVAGGALFALGMALRYWSMWALGPRWSTRVYVLPMPLVRRGPYRFLPHPIYVGVTLEIAGLALAVGAWWTLALVLPLHLLALRRRIAVEVAALHPAREGAAASRSS